VAAHRRRRPRTAHKLTLSACREQRRCRLRACQTRRADPGASGASPDPKRMLAPGLGGARCAMGLSGHLSNPSGPLGALLRGPPGKGDRPVCAAAGGQVALTGQATQTIAHPFASRRVT
jgi:hypothetical protein